MPQDAKPPKQWWDKMVKEISSGNPDYSKDRVKKIVGDIWYNELTQKKRDEIQGRYASMKRNAALFTSEDAGVWADGTLGHSHIREVLADLMKEMGHSSLAKELRGPMSDDASEEDEALDVLNDNTEEGVFWEFYEGDLVLVETDDDEEFYASKRSRKTSKRLARRRATKRPIRSRRRALARRATRTKKPLRRTASPRNALPRRRARRVKNPNFDRFLRRAKMRARLKSRKPVSASEKKAKLERASKHLEAAAKLLRTRK